MFKLQSPVSLLQEGDKGSQPLASQNVVVLAKNFNLTKAQLELLNRGLTFVPTIDLTKNQKKQLELDIQTYHRKIKLATYFRHTKKDTPLPFRPPSNWTPPPHKLLPEIHLLIQKDNKDFKQFFRFHQEKQNLSQDEVKALRELMNNKQIVIKPADKGSSVVILGREQYITEVHRQLTDKNYYKKLERPIYLESIPLVHDILETLKIKGFINNKQKQYLKGDAQLRERRFYILPKIHKEPEKWSIPFEVPPGRPIVSDCSSETYRTAEYIDYYLNPLSVKHASYVKDTYHFTEIVKNLKIPPSSLFFTIDIDSLYTNIDTRAGLSAVNKVFQKYPDDNRPDEELLQLLEINLTRNDFEFNREYYLQIKGTAMGKRFAPAYANIFMANWEEEALSKCPKKPLKFLRYLDDIWGIWTDSREDFDQFLNILNTHDPSIKLKHVIGEQSIDFLDTTVYKGPSFIQDQKLDIKVYFKSTDTHALLFKTSFHPKHTFKGIVKSQLLRFHRICTQENDFREAVNILFTVLRKRGYSRSFLRHCRKSFHVRKQAKQKEIIPLITSFSSVSAALNNKFKANFRSIIEDLGVLQNHQIISAYRRNNTLKDLLVNARLKPTQQAKARPKPQYFHGLTYIRNRVNKTIFKISQKFSPSTSNCVYLIFCCKCGMQYIGETKNSISTRMMQHRYNIKNRKEIHTPVVNHFITHGLPNLRVSGIQSNSSWTDAERKKMERKWIHLLSTIQPSGLNKKYN